MSTPEDEAPDPAPDQADVEEGAGFVGDYPEQGEAHVDEAAPDE